MVTGPRLLGEGASVCAQNEDGVIGGGGTEDMCLDHTVGANVMVAAHGTSSVSGMLPR